jgi:hypothetical protein
MLHIVTRLKKQAEQAPVFLLYTTRLPLTLVFLGAEKSFVMYSYKNAQSTMTLNFGYGAFVSWHGIKYGVEWASLLKK